MKNISDCIRVPGAINKFKFDFGNDDNEVTSRSIAQLIMYIIYFFYLIYDYLFIKKNIDYKKIQQMYFLINYKNDILLIRN